MASVAPAGVPNAERLAHYKEEWLRLLREALPPLEVEPEGPPASATPLLGEPRSPGASASGAGAGAPGDTWSPGIGSDARTPGSEGVRGSEGLGSSFSGSGSFLESLGLERFFGDARPCRQDASDSGGAASERGEPRPSAFKVQVPKQYPGVQYRRSKNLNDRYPRYAKLGTVVTGHVEDGGEWLRISDQVFLPMKVGGIQILEPTHQDPTEMNGGAKSLKSLWFACSQGNHGEEQEVVTDLKETN